MVGKTVEKEANYVADPSGLRTGNPPDQKMAEILQREALKLEDYISKNQVQSRVSLTLEEINERINNVRGAVTMAYPLGLPEWDLVRVALDEPIDNLKVSLYRAFLHLYCILPKSTKFPSISFRIHT